MLINFAGATNDANQGCEGTVFPTPKVGVVRTFSPSTKWRLCAWCSSVLSELQQREREREREREMAIKAIRLWRVVTYWLDSDREGTIINDRWRQSSTWLSSRRRVWPKPYSIVKSPAEVSHSRCSTLSCPRLHFMAYSVRPLQIVTIPWKRTRPQTGVGGKPKCAVPPPLILCKNSAKIISIN